MKKTLENHKMVPFKDSKWSLCTKSRLFEGLSLVPFMGQKSPNKHRGQTTYDPTSKAHAEPLNLCRLGGVELLEALLLPLLLDGEVLVAALWNLTIFYGSGSDFRKVMVPVSVPTFEKLWFRFRFQLHI
jgi:hypothetical protein